MRIQLICWSLVLCVLIYCAPPSLAAESRQRTSETVETASLPNPDIMAEDVEIEIWMVPEDPTNFSDGRGGEPQVILFSISGSNPFSDVDPSSPFYEAVLWAVGNGITNGTSATTFSPNEQCKRKHIITFTWRGSGKPFDDSWIYPYEADSSLTSDSDFGKAATWAFYKTVEQGTVTADAHLMFNPNWDCNRGQAVIYLWRLSGRPRDGVDLGVLNQFTDVRIDNRTDDAYTRELPYAVAWAVQNGITNGTTKTTFSPRNAVTRGHIVTFLYRFSKTSDGKRILNAD